jgi:hypothetical protein
MQANIRASSGIIPVSERAKMIHALDRATTVIGSGHELLSFKF